MILLVAACAALAVVVWSLWDVPATTGHVLLIVALYSIGSPRRSK